SFSLADRGAIINALDHAEGDGGEDADDRDDGQELDQRESVASGTHQRGRLGRGGKAYEGGHFTAGNVGTTRPQTISGNRKHRGCENETRADGLCNEKSGIGRSRFAGTEKAAR